MPQDIILPIDYVLSYAPQVRNDVIEGSYGLTAYASSPLLNIKYSRYVITNRCRYMNTSCLPWARALCTRHVISWVSSLLLQYLVWFTEAWLYIYPSISWVYIESSNVFALARHRYNIFMTLDLHVLWTGLWGKHLDFLIDTIFSVIKIHLNISPAIRSHVNSDTNGPRCR